jgi:hypothetical protein
VDAPFQVRENVRVVVARGRMLSFVRPWMRQDDSRRPVWEFAGWVQITQSVLEAQWKSLVVPAPSRRLLRHTLLPLALTSSRSRSAYAAAAGVLQVPPLTSRAQMRRAILLARATVTSIWACEPTSAQATSPWVPASAGLLNHRTRPNNQQAADHPFAAFRNGTEFLLAAGRFLQRRQSKPSREMAPGRKSLGRWH